MSAALLTIIKEKDREIARLREALAPFATFVTEYELRRNPQSPSRMIFLERSGIGVDEYQHVLDFGMLHKARAALTPQEVPTPPHA